MNLILSFNTKIPDCIESVPDKIELKSVKNETYNNSRISKDILGLITFIAIINFFSNITLTGFQSWMPTFFRVNRNIDAILVGQSLSLFWIGLTLGRILVSFLSKKIKVEKILYVLTITCSLFAVSSLLVKGAFLYYYCIFWLVLPILGSILPYYPLELLYSITEGI